MAPFEVLYGHRCRTPLNWIEPGEKVIFGPNLLEEDANKKRRPLEFEVGDHVYLIVSPMKGVNRFGVKGKLAPHYIRLFPILKKCGTVTHYVFQKLDWNPCSLVCIINIVRYEFQKPNSFLFIQTKHFGTCVVTRFLASKCAQLNSLL
jgi:hypothetical protein